MVKYSSVLKAQIINEHLSDGTSGAELKHLSSTKRIYGLRWYSNIINNSILNKMALCQILLIDSFYRVESHATFNSVFLSGLVFIWRSLMREII
ncbi:MAG: hypothetical protein ABF585_12265 [Lacticaseibacillus paracasei]|uniref:hypothetical protein n=1 Tax=Lacticaseibacillus paracasei TaxID=1597 RepID=UPI0021C36F0A|nr:hypothetical protein [Lacticaseibacillus paracasei]